MIDLTWVAAQCIWAMLIGLGLRDPEWTFERLETAIRGRWSVNLSCIRKFQICGHCYELILTPPSEHGILVYLTIDAKPRGNAIASALTKQLTTLNNTFAKAEAKAEAPAA